MALNGSAMEVVIIVIPMARHGEDIKVIIVIIAQ